MTSHTFKVPPCRMIVRYSGLQFVLQFVLGRTHSLMYVG